MDTKYQDYTLEKLPDDSLIIWAHDKKPLPEVVGFCTLQEAISGTNPNILNTNYLFKYTLRKEFLGDGMFIPLPYKSKDSGQVVLVHCGYDLVLEQFYANIVTPLGLTNESVALFIEKYNSYIGDRKEREQEELLNAKLRELSELTGTPIEVLRKKVVTTSK